VNAKYSVSNHSSNRKIVKCIANGFPYFDIKFSFALIIESINFVYFRTLVVTSKKKKIVWKLDFISHEESETLK
jgi:hypothetical protein